MKIFILAMFLSFTALQTFAQVSAEKLLYLEKSTKYKRMKNTGTILTLAGSVLVVAGMVTMLNAAEDTNAYYGTTPQADNDKFTQGVVMYVFGAAGVGVGVPLWIVGGISHGKYNRKLQQLSARVVVSPQASGLHLFYRF